MPVPVGGGAAKDTQNQKLLLLRTLDDKYCRCRAGLSVCDVTVEEHTAYRGLCPSLTAMKQVSDMFSCFDQNLVLCL